MLFTSNSNRRAPPGWDTVDSVESYILFLYIFQRNSLMCIYFQIKNQRNKLCDKILTAPVHEHFYNLSYVDTVNLWPYCILLFRCSF